MEIMKSYVNLLPLGVRRQQVMRRWLRRWFVIGCVAVYFTEIAT